MWLETCIGYVHELSCIWWKSHICILLIPGGIFGNTYILITKKRGETEIMVLLYCALSSCRVFPPTAWKGSKRRVEMWDLNSTVLSCKYFAENCILSFGWFPGVWILCDEVSDRSFSSVFVGGVSRKGNHPKERIQHSEQEESLKLRSQKVELRNF